MGRKHIDSIHRKIIDYLESAGKWDVAMTNGLPNSYEKYGDFLLFTAPSFSGNQWKELGTEFWEFICTIYKGKRVGIKKRIQNDSFRTPQAEVVYGQSPMIHFVDNGIVFTWNVEKNMFCTGNITERHRIGSLDCTGEVIVDLYAGIGYFTLPYLKKANAKFVHACEWNPDAVLALKLNLEKNGVVDRCKIYMGDNRNVCPRRVANRVNLGLIPSSETSWEVACDALFDTGGILYVHQNVTSGITQQGVLCADCNEILNLTRLQIEVSVQTGVLQCASNKGEVCASQFDHWRIKWKKIEWFYFSVHLSHCLLNLLCKIHGNEWTVSVREVFKVKSYAPHIDHLVFSAFCYPASS